MGKVISQKKLKTEGTSKTFGQFILPSSKTNMGQNKSTQSKSSSATSVNVTKTTNIAFAKGAIVDSQTKVQIIFAAVNSNKNSTVIIPDNSRQNDFPTDLGSGETSTEIVTVLDSSTLSKEQVLNVLTEAQKVDLSIALKSKDSVPVEFNNLQVPENDASFVYQHWSKSETNLDFQEDPAKDPLLTKKLKDIPLYVELRWESINVVEQITENKISRDKDTEDLKNRVLKAPRGFGNLANGVTSKPVGKFLKNINLSKSETSKGKIVDIHEPEKGFDSISNKHQFANSIHSTVSTKKDQFDQNSLLELIKKTIV